MLTALKFGSISNKYSSLNFKGASSVVEPAYLSQETQILPSKRKEYIKQELPEELYFIRMTGYGRDKKWAKAMNETTNELTDMVFKKQPFDKIIKTAQNKVWSLNNNANPYFGVRKGVGFHSGFEVSSAGRGEEYQSRYFNRLFKGSEYQEEVEPIKINSNDEYKKANTCTIHRADYDEYSGIHTSVVDYGKRTPFRSNLTLCKKEYKKLLSKKNPSLQEILKSTATIHWLIAQETPWYKGSDSIANLVTKSILQAHNVELSPVKIGRSFDFEAFYTDLDDYIKIYPKLFEKEPRLLNDFCAIA